MTEKKRTNLEGVEIPRPPVSATVPEGWPDLKIVDGKYWYDKAMAWEKHFGRPLLPLKYTYTAYGELALASEYTEEDRAKDVEEIMKEIEGAGEEAEDGTGTKSS